jgi:hypothetical protein
MISYVNIDLFVNSFKYVDKASALLGIKLDKFERLRKDPLELKVFNPYFKYSKAVFQKRNRKIVRHEVIFKNENDIALKEKFEKETLKVFKILQKDRENVKIEGQSFADLVIQELEIYELPTLKEHIANINYGSIPLSEAIEEIEHNLMNINNKDARFVYAKKILRYFGDIALFFDPQERDLYERSKIVDLGDIIFKKLNRRKSFEIQKCLQFLKWVTPLEQTGSTNVPNWGLDAFVELEDKFKEYRRPLSYSFAEQYLLLMRNYLQGFAESFEACLFEFSINLSDLEEELGVFILQKRHSDTYTKKRRFTPLDLEKRSFLVDEPKDLFQAGDECVTADSTLVKERVIVDW